MLTRVLWFTLGFLTSKAISSNKCPCADKKKDVKVDCVAHCKMCKKRPNIDHDENNQS